MEDARQTEEEYNRFKNFKKNDLNELLFLLDDDFLILKEIIKNKLSLLSD